MCIKYEDMHDIITMFIIFRVVTQIKLKGLSF